MDVKCWVPLWNQSQASSDCDLAKILEWVQRPISSCYFRLCKFAALSSSCSLFSRLYGSLALCPLCTLGKVGSSSEGWGGRLGFVDGEAGLSVESDNPFLPVPGSDQIQSPKPLRHGTLDMGKNPNKGHGTNRGAAPLGACSQWSGVIDEKYVFGIHSFRAHSQLIAILFLNYASLCFAWVSWWKQQINWRKIYR